MKTENLNWFDGLYHVRAGQFITRDGWNNPEKKVYLDIDGDGIPDTVPVDSDRAVAMSNNYGMKLDANSLNFLQCIYLVEPGQDPQKAYHPIQADFIATDWRVIP
ncbi:Protein of unknown function [Dyadobacter sp. SG02]|uniref:Thoeris anti-defense Tad2 family protein n=1 Tax=Dyadobacter sp. SG02 TaxID=1855291 RepID=UPI0008C9DC89|nr:MW1434 family type I TA system toxin [Dyadobacter sp. SG02]SEI39377.1 Protein of unknown function [Dyadobacter sp. SG02]